MRKVISPATGQRGLAAVAAAVAVSCSLLFAQGAAADVSGAVTVNAVASDADPTLGQVSATVTTAVSGCGASCFSYATVYVVGSGQPCTNTASAIEWVGASHTTDGNFTEAASWLEDTSVPASRTACLYVNETLVAQADFQVRGACVGLMKLRALPATVAYHRDLPVVIAASGGAELESIRHATIKMYDSSDDSLFYQSSLTSKDLASLSDEELSYYMNFEPEDAGGYARLDWTDDHGCTDSVRTGAVKPVKPRGKLTVTHASVAADDGRDGEVRIGGGATPCRLLNGSPLRVLVRGAGRARTLRLDEACGRWAHATSSLPGLLITAGDGAGSQAAVLHLAASTSAGPGRVFTITVLRGRLRLKTLRVRASYVDHPDQRVFEGTDAFVNYCINRTKKLYSSHLRLYCIRPGHTDSHVSIRG